MNQTSPYPIDQWTPLYLNGKTEWIDPDGKTQKFPRFDEIKERCNLPKMPSVDEMFFAPARRIASELEGKNIPAAELTDEQKCALLTLAGFMRYENGRLVSIRPVGIWDDGNVKYIVAIAPEKP